MGWARLDDGFHDHPKLIGLPLEAIGLYTVCLTWAHRHRGSSNGTLGHIPPELPGRFAGVKGKRLASLLESHALWDRDPSYSGWVIHDFEDYLPAVDRPATADEVRKARSDAGKRGAAARWGKAKAATSERQPDDKLLSESHSKPMPPSRPVPSPLTTDVVSGSPTDFDAFWTVYPRREAKQAARKAWDKVTRSVDAATVIAGARRYADDPNRDRAFTKHAATWLNGGCWDDDPLPPRTTKPNRDQIADEWAARGRRMQTVLDQGFPDLKVIEG